ncbi:MAG: hypothetical protein ABFC84_08735 [Veillonellales bacterium]
MRPEVINLHDKRIEQSVVRISAKIADAVKMVQKAKEMAISSEDVLIKAQLELEEIYIVLDKPSISCDDTGIGD